MGKSAFIQGAFFVVTSKVPVIGYIVGGGFAAKELVAICSSNSLRG